jgi:hypothetical protein
MRVVGDGDSSVFARIREEVPGWGRYVTKEEYAHHICKCYRANLEKLVTANPLQLFNSSGFIKCFIVKLFRSHTDGTSESTYKSYSGVF